MKKAIALILALVMCFSLSACGGTATAPESESSTLSSESSEAENTVTYAENEVALEVVGYEATPSAFIVNIDFKFRNISDKNFDRMTFTAQALDANGDVIESTIMGEEDISAGQATWFTFQTNDSRSSQTIEELAEKIHSIKVLSVQLTTDELDPYATYDLDFEDPIIIAVADVQDKESISTAPSAESSTEAVDEDTAGILISSTWNRTDETGNVLASMYFHEDGTGNMDLDDGDSYEFKWSVGADDMIEVILVVDGKDAPGTYVLTEESGTYSIQMTDNAKFTYFAE